MTATHIDYIDPVSTPLESVWVNPLGGLGDAVMVSTALKVLHERTGRQVNMMRRTGRSWLFAGHPAIKEYGNPPRDAIILSTDYWGRDIYGTMPALEVIFKMFGLGKETLPQSLWINQGDTDETTRLMLATVGIDTVPTVIISPGSDSPRKMLSPERWQQVADRLNQAGLRVIVTGIGGEHVPAGCYSLAGVTSPRQIVPLAALAKAVITPDSYIAHVAKAVGTPAVVLFGPTNARVYGYDGNINLAADTSGCPHCHSCLGPHVPDNYTTECPEGDRRCVDTIDIDSIVNATLSLITI